MKKLGLILAFALLSHGAAADKAGNLANLSVLVAETAASSSWVAQERTIEDKAEEKLNEQVTEVNRQLDREIEERFNRMLQTHTESL